MPCIGSGCLNINATAGGDAATRWRSGSATRIGTTALLVSSLEGEDGQPVGVTKILIHRDGSESTRQSGGVGSHDITVIHIGVIRSIGYAIRPGTGVLNLLDPPGRTLLEKGHSDGPISPVRLIMSGILDHIKIGKTADLIDLPGHAGSRSGSATGSGWYNSSDLP